MANTLTVPAPQILTKDAEFQNLLQVLGTYWKELVDDPEFDIYEGIGGNYRWRAVSIGIIDALHTIQALSERSSNEFVLMHTASGKAILRLNVQER